MGSFQRPTFHDCRPHGGEEERLDGAEGDGALRKASGESATPAYFRYGPSEAELRQQAQKDGIAHLVSFSGFLQTAEISQAYGSTLALILPSVEEQFGNVIPEHLAMGLPAILSDNCGSRDTLVRTGVMALLLKRIIQSARHTSCNCSQRMKPCGSGCALPVNNS